MRPRCFFTYDLIFFHNNIIFIYKCCIMKEYKRICKECGKELFYKSYPAYWLAEKNNALCRNCATKKAVERKCDLSVLLEETPESYYWIGFLMADGNFNNGRISFTLAKKDEEQVLKFAKFIKWTGKIKTTPIYAGISPMHKEAVDKICEKFDLKKNKTYNPPETILNHDKELLKYLLIGFIDGDGTINECSIRFRVHSSWINILKEFSKLINSKNNPTITKDGYAYFRINRAKAFEILLPLIICVPCLKRKWDRLICSKNKTIDYYKTSCKTKEVVRLIESGMQAKEVSEKLNITKDNVLRIKSRYGINVKRVDKEKSLDLKRKILMLLSENMKYKDISRKLNVSISYISKIRKKNGESGL